MRRLRILAAALAGLALLAATAAPALADRAFLFADRPLIHRGPHPRSEVSPKPTQRGDGRVRAAPAPALG